MLEEKFVHSENYLDRAIDMPYIGNVVIKLYLRGIIKCIDLSHNINLVDKQQNMAMLLPALFKGKDKDYQRMVRACISLGLENAIK